MTEKSLPKTQKAQFCLSVNRTKIDSKEQAGKITNYQLESFNMEDLTEIEKILKFHNHTTNVFRGSRNAANNVGVSGIMLDYDNGTSFEGLRNRFKDYIHIIYTTTSHTEEKPKFRAILPFKEIAFQDNAREFYQYLKSLPEFKDADPSCFEPGRHFYPCCPPGRDNFKFFVHQADKCYPIPILPKTTAKNPVTPDKWQKAEFSGFKKCIQYILENGVESGKRNDSLTRLASEFGKLKIDGKTAYNQLREWNKNSPEPIPINEFDRTYESAYQGGIEGKYDFGCNDHVLKDVCNQCGGCNLKPEKKDDEVLLTDEFKALLERILTDKKPVVRPLIDYSYGIDDFISDAPEAPIRLSRLTWTNLVTLLWNTEKGGKSWFALSDIKEAADRGWNSMWISADEAAAIIADKFGRLKGLSGKVRVLHKPRRWEEIILAIHVHKPKIVFFDSLSTILKSTGCRIPQTHESEEWAGLIMIFSNIAEYLNTNVCLIAHAKKDGTQYRGSGSIGACVDILIEMQTKKARNLAITKIEGRAREDGEEEIWNWNGQDKGYSKFHSTLTKPLTIGQIEVLKLLLDGPMRRKDIADKTGIARTTLSRIRNELKIKSDDKKRWYLPKDEIEQMLKDNETLMGGKDVDELLNN